MKNIWKIVVVGAFVSNMNVTKFYRLDYAQVGTTSRGCLRVIRSDEQPERETSKKTKKIKDGDKVKSGVRKF